MVLMAQPLRTAYTLVNGLIVCGLQSAGQRYSERKSGSGVMSGVLCFTF